MPLFDSHSPQGKTSQAPMKFLRLRQPIRPILMPCLALTFFLLHLFASDRIVEDESSPTIVFRKIAVAGKKFDEKYAVQRCREFLSANQDKDFIRGFAEGAIEVWEEVKGQL